MKITSHARRRIYERTRLIPRHVHTIMANKAFVEFGSANSYVYAAFYSPPDHGPKIAVMSQDRSHLLSVWEKHYVLHRNIPLVTEEVEGEARLKLARLLRSKMITDRTSFLDVTLDARVGERILQRVDGGEVSRKCACSRHSILSAVAKRLPPLIKYVAEVRGMMGRVRFGIHLINPCTFLQMRDVLTFHPSTVVRYAEQAA